MEKFVYDSTTGILRTTRNHDADYVQEHLSTVARGGEPTEKLEFDPATGKLRVTRTPSIDNVVATQMAGDGFFALVYTT